MLHKTNMSEYHHTWYNTTSDFRSNTKPALWSAFPFATCPSKHKFKMTAGRWTRCIPGYVEGRVAGRSGRDIPWSFQTYCKDKDRDGNGRISFWDTNSGQHEYLR